MTEPDQTLTESLDGPGLAIRSSSSGSTVIDVTGSPWPLNPNGAMHGGIVTAAAMQAATLTASDDRSGHSRARRPVAVSMAFQRPALPPLSIVASARGDDESPHFVTVTVEAAGGEVCASALVTLSDAVPELAPETTHPRTLPPRLPAPAELILPPHNRSPAALQEWAESLPVSRVIGLRCASVTANHMTIVIDPPPGRDHLVPDWLVAAWVDHCFGLAAFTSVRPGSVPATASLSLQHLRASRGELTVEASVSKSGRTLAFIDVVVIDASGSVTTTASGTMSVDGSSRPVASMA